MTGPPGTAPRPQICRICHNGCAILVDVDDAGRPVRVRGDRDNPVYGGYTCVKGRSAPALHNSPDRLLHPLKRTASGTFVRIPLDDAVGEIAEQVQRMLDRHGPRSLISYAASGMLPQTAITPVLGAFHKAIGSPWRPYTADSIDQAGKSLALAMHGRWGAPAQGYDDPQVAVIVGSNPLVSHQGFPQGAPRPWLDDRIAAGMTLVVVDPRRTETARRAHLHLQARPGSDGALLAGLIHVVLAEDLLDRRFVEDHARGVAELRAATAPFRPDVVAGLAGVDAEDVVRTARLFAGAERAFLAAGTGANMSGQGTLVEYLVLCLHTLCGRWLRSGEVVRDAPALMSPQRWIAQAEDPVPAYGYGEPLRVRGLADTAAGHQITGLVDEMTLEGEGRIRALLCAGGNPAAAWPDQRRTLAGLRSLELLVVLDPFFTATAELAHYVVPPKMMLEVPATTLLQDYLGRSVTGFGYVDSHAQYAPPAAEPPPGAELMEEWEFVASVAERMGLELRLRRTPLHRDGRRLTTPELLDLITRGSRVPLDEVRRHPHGALFRDDDVRVAPGTPDWPGRLDLGNGDMMGELAALAVEPPRNEPDRPFRFVVRRLPHVQNSALHDVAEARAAEGNRAYLHPDDLSRLGAVEGDLLEVASRHGAVTGVAAADPGLRRGVLSMAHGWGPLPGPGVRSRPGVNTGLLVDAEDADPYSAQPRMSAIPVSVRAAGRSAGQGAVEAR